VIPARPIRAENQLDRTFYEQRARKAGRRVIAGLDEVGRGPLAGPLVAACVVLPKDTHGWEEVIDSKKIPSSQRRELFIFIHEKAGDIGVGIVDSYTIDRINVLQATFLAMQRAVSGLSREPDYLLIDGNQHPPWAQNAETIVKGDSLSLSIAAASIIAKVTRDNVMQDYDSLYPKWGFARHKGYGTSQHLTAIREHGICELHRRSFAQITQLEMVLSSS
jgi:ribonuclease HII